MEDKTPKKEPAETPLDVAPVLDSDPEKPDRAGPRGKTAGERIHFWSTYLGIDWIFNAMAGVSFAYWGKYSKLGQKIWSDPISRGLNRALSPIKNNELRQKSVEYGNIFFGVIAGGMFTLPPLRVLESKKVKKSIIGFYDRLIYGKEKVESDPKFREAYDAIDNEPKKNFWAGLAARGCALLPLLLIVLIPWTAKVSDKIWFNHVEKLSEKAARLIGRGPEKFKNISPQEAGERWNFIHRSIATDAGLGIPYALLHSFFYNLFANWMGKKKSVAKNEISQNSSRPETQRVTNNSNETLPDDGRATSSTRHAERVDATTASAALLGVPAR